MYFRAAYFMVVWIIWNGSQGTHLTLFSFIHFLYSAQKCSIADVRWELKKRSNILLLPFSAVEQLPESEWEKYFFLAIALHFWPKKRGRMEHFKLMHSTFGRKIMAPCNAFPAHLSFHIKPLKYWKLSEIKFSFEWNSQASIGKKLVCEMLKAIEVEGNAKWMISAFSKNTKCVFALNQSVHLSEFL